MKVAIIHDWMTLKGGGEWCVEQLLAIYPQADLFCVVEFLAEDDRTWLHGREVHTSFIQRLPGARKRYRSYLPLMPIAVEQFDLTGYDLVISSSSSVAKGVITGPDQVHIAYTHSPIRYAWDLQFQYLREAGLERGMKSAVARVILHYMRIWDSRTAHGVDHFVANSGFVARRIRKAYGREATIIHPPVDIERFVFSERREDFYVTMSRMVPYKRIPLIVEAFRHMPDRRLVVIGEGPDFEAARRLAGPNVTLMGRQPDAVVVSHLQRAKAFLFAAEEDFGIAPVEAQACGTPVIAYGKGGALETIRGHDAEGQTGVFFDRQTPEAIVAAVEHFEQRLHTITPEACRANAERFAVSRFREEITHFVEAAMALHTGQVAQAESLAQLPQAPVD
ncbi:glycosyltransferase family 4 protein [Hoeflea sp.]|uniref:glycosyltransferase family 4 protein n=1 Tax=Hoeflea sp. TaxID=1940281 RepID=UPI0019CF233C|nr:glycosyltransferase family 4 protein [Hoeflea sp.]MBC7281934.1 glycosyltransferase family 4 protein [Hoeflea sp.]